MPFSLPSETEARFIFPGDVVSIPCLDPQYAPLVIEVSTVAVSGDDVLVEGLDILGGAESAHLYLHTPVHIQRRGPERQRREYLGELRAEIDAYKEDAR